MHVPIPNLCQNICCNVVCWCHRLWQGKKCCIQNLQQRKKRETFFFFYNSKMQGTYHRWYASAVVGLLKIFVKLHHETNDNRSVILLDRKWLVRHSVSQLVSVLISFDKFTFWKTWSVQSWWEIMRKKLCWYLKNHRTTLFVCEL